MAGGNFGAVPNPPKRGSNSCANWATAVANSVSPTDMGAAIRVESFSRAVNCPACRRSPWASWCQYSATFLSTDAKPGRPHRSVGGK